MEPRAEIERIKSDTRASALWWLVKAVFGVLVVVGVNNINHKMDEIAQTSLNQRLDHEALSDMKENQRQLVMTLQSVSASINANTAAIKYLNERQSKDDDFRESHGAKLPKQWTHP